MSRGNRDYNGLHLPGGASSEAQQKMAIAQHIDQLAKGIFVRVASNVMSADGDQWPSRDVYREIASQSQSAALAYFENLGVIEVDSSEGDRP